MKIVADTNILLRAVLGDDPVQSKIAQSLLSNAKSVFIPAAALCEFAWVLSRGSRASAEEVQLAIRTITAGQNVLVDRPAVFVGLAMLASGGDFADGIIAYESSRDGAEFVSFDRHAVKLAKLHGLPARVPS